MKMERRTNMNFRKHIGMSVLPVALVLASGVSCFAKNSERITFLHDVVVNGTTLPAGHYTVQWNNDSPAATVEFSQHRKVVRSTDGKVLTRKGNYRSMTLETPDKGFEAVNVFDPLAMVFDTAPDGTMSLVEIRLAASNKVLVFNK
jgi:hypothetical protein